LQERGLTLPELQVGEFELAQELQPQAQGLQPVLQAQELKLALHRRRLLQALHQLEQFDQSLQLFSARCRQLVKESRYQPCQLILLGVVHPLRHDRLRI
jgi:hypothetical protein